MFYSSSNDSVHPKFELKFAPLFSQVFIHVCESGAVSLVTTQFCLFQLNTHFLKLLSGEMMIVSQNNLDLMAFACECVGTVSSEAGDDGTTETG